MIKSADLPRFDAAQYLTTNADIGDYLSEAFATADASYIAHAIGTVARARGMTQLARDTGLTRPALYKALSEAGRPELSTVLKVLTALGVQLQATPLAPDELGSEDARVS